MSWHTNAILIRADLSKDYPAMFDMLGLGGAQPGELVSLEDASSALSECVAVGTIEDWTVLWGNMALYMIAEGGVANLAKTADVFQMILEGASGTAGFTWYTCGGLARDWMRQDGEIIKDEGNPLPEEQNAFADQDDEQAVWQLLVALTLPYEKLEAIRYQMYALPDEVF
jgi:hypothetical protein